MISESMLTMKFKYALSNKLVFTNTRVKINAELMTIVVVTT